MKNGFRIGTPRGRLVEGCLHWLDAAVGVGLISGAAITTAFGQVILGLLFGILACGVFVRMTRRLKQQNSTTSISSRQTRGR